MKNIFYFRKISRIGGTEQFLYEIAKRYHGYDITIFYDTADKDQLERLKKYLPCVQRDRNSKEKICCERAFYNFNLDMIEQVEAKEHVFIAHANYEELGYKPPIDHPKLTKLVGVSEFARERLDDYAKKLGIDMTPTRCYNPISLEPTKKVLHIVSAGRLDDEVKGGERTLKLIEALDRYCKINDRQYLWLVFSNPMSISLPSPNVAVMSPRIDVRPYIADSDWCVQLSNDMETYCYTINEALGYGVPIVTTPLSIIKELPIPKGANLVCDYGMEKADEIAKAMFEQKVPKFSYTPPADGWEKLLAKGKSKYKPPVYTTVSALDTYKRLNIIDSELGYIPAPGDIFSVDDSRLETLLGKNRYKLRFVELASTKPVSGGEA